MSTHAENGRIAESAAHDWEPRKTPEGYTVMFCKVCDLPYWGDVNIETLPPCTQSDGSQGGPDA